MSALPSPALPEVHFRRIEDRDIETVAAIERDVYDFPWTAGNFRDALLAGYRFWGAWVVEGGREYLAGYGILMLAVDESHLLNIAVARPWQGRGLGRRLVQFILSEARRHECVMLYLEVRPSNAVALSLYKSLGFTQLGLRKDYYPAHGGRENALFLGLELI